MTIKIFLSSFSSLLSPKQAAQERILAASWTASGNKVRFSTSISLTLEEEVKHHIQFFLVYVLGSSSTLLIARLFAHLLPIELGLLNFFLTGKLKQHKDLTVRQDSYIQHKGKAGCTTIWSGKTIGMQLHKVTLQSVLGGEKSMLGEKENVVCTGGVERIFITLDSLPSKLLGPEVIADSITS